MLSNKELIDTCEKAILRFSGNSAKLKAAIGMLHMGRLLGWRAMYLMHDKKTIRNYEEILGISIREVLPEDGEFSKKSVAWVAAQKISNFWKAVSGEEPGIKSPDLKK